MGTLCLVMTNLPSFNQVWQKSRRVTPSGMAGSRDSSNDAKAPFLASFSQSRRAAIGTVSVSRLCQRSMHYFLYGSKRVWRHHLDLIKSIVDTGCQTRPESTEASTGQAYLHGECGCVAITWCHTMWPMLLFGSKEFLLTSHFMYF